MPSNNTWALIAAAAATVGVFVLSALLNFFGTGDAWPADIGGWLRIVVPALCAGLLAVISPRYSLTEARTGQRHINSARGDAPVLDLSSKKRVIDDPGDAHSEYLLAPTDQPPY